MEDKSNFNSHDLITNKEYFNDFDEILTCHICKGFQIVPMQCSICQNSFCSGCLQTWDRKRLGNFSCIFKCKDNIFIKDCKPILKMLEKLVIKCYRCSTDVNYADLANHVNRTCGKKMVACRNHGCRELITQESIEDHNETCDYMKINCEECGSYILRRDKNSKTSSITRDLAYEYVSDMFSLIDKEVEQTYHISKFDLIKKKLKYTGIFLEPEQIEIIFDKLLEYHYKKIDDNYEGSLIKILYYMLKNHKDIFEEDKTLSEKLLNKFLNVYSLDNISDYDLRKALWFLNTIIFHLGEYIPWNSDNISLIVKSMLKFLEHKNAIVREWSITILGNMSCDCSKEFNVYLVDILNSISNALNYKEEGKYNEQRQCTRDWAIWAIGNTIQFRADYIDTSEWIPKWLSYFRLESGIKQENSYDVLCEFIRDKPQILYGVNNQFLPSIIKILLNDYEDDYFKLRDQDCQNTINSFFERIRNDSNLLECVKIAKANSEGRILEKLNKYFP